VGLLKARARSEPLTEAEALLAEYTDVRYTVCSASSWTTPARGRGVSAPHPDGSLRLALTLLIAER
jgi:hypothetical protein